MPNAITKRRGSAGLRSVVVGRQVDADDLVSAVEIARRLDVRRGVVYDWRRRYPEFPEPVAQLGSVHVWVWGDVEAWAQETGRL